MLRIVARRVETLPALIVATYRDDELDRRHPLRRALGELNHGDRTTRLAVEPLSPDAVAALAAPHGVDADDLYRKTNGNAFFVTEVLAADGAEVPETARDAVLARAARLSPRGDRAPRGRRDRPTPRRARDPRGDRPERRRRARGMPLLRDAARRRRGCLLPPRARPARDRELAPGSPPHRAEQARARGARAVGRRGRRSREARPPRRGRRRRRRRAALRAGRRRQGGRSRSASRGRGSVRAGAARRRELSPAERGDLLERRAFSCYITDQNPEALAALREAVECYRAAGDRYAEGRAFRILSNYLWCPGHVDESLEAGVHAVELLEPLGPSRELGGAYCNLAYLGRTSCDHETTAKWAALALDAGEEFGDYELMASALMQLGESEALARVGPGFDKLDRATDLALEHGLDEATAWIDHGRARTLLAARMYPEAGRRSEGRDPLLQRARPRASRSLPPHVLHGGRARAGALGERRRLRGRRPARAPRLDDSDDPRADHSRAPAVAARRPGPVVAARRGAGVGRGERRAAADRARSPPPAPRRSGSPGGRTRSRRPPTRRSRSRCGGAMDG